MRHLLCAPLLAPLVVACSTTPSAAPAAPTQAVSTAPATSTGPGASPPDYATVPREKFNTRAAELALPLFWERDGDGNGRVDPSEVAVLWGPGTAKLEDYVSGGAFTPAFDAAYRAIVSSDDVNVTGLDAEERERRALVREELAQGRPTVLRTRLENTTDEDRAILRHVTAAARMIEEIHARQLGTDRLQASVGTDPASRALLHRNQTPWCVAPRTEGNPACRATTAPAKKVFGLYPAALQEKPDFCDGLRADPSADRLRDPFTVVRANGGALEAVPYHVAYADRMQPIAAELDAAAVAIKSPGEAPFKRYLVAAAKAFRDGSWQAADEAWAAMNAQNSKWYLRIGPDEVYFEPCSLKAGFHVSFARINQGSLVWQQKLDPVKGEMEAALAKLAGAPYKARKVAFHLPDFIDIILNAGDARNPHGATIGQSLPNWGPVANEGRGRTVAMTNLYTDPDSLKSNDERAKALFCSATHARYTTDPAPLLMSTVLHEAAHNLGPAHEYKVNGKTDREAFGGPIASMMEELKAQTAALYFTDWLAERKVVEASLAKQAHLADVAWAFGHISRGLYDSDGRARPYSQLAAVQFGVFLEQGALLWKADEKAANGTDVGCFDVVDEKLESTVVDLMTRVAGIKARGERAAAEALVLAYADTGKSKQPDAKAQARWDRLAKLHQTITERCLREPKATFVYAIE